MTRGAGVVTGGLSHGLWDEVKLVKEGYMASVSSVQRLPSP